MSGFHLTPEQKDLVEKNVRLVPFVLGKHWDMTDVTGVVSNDDWISIGYMGLCKAAARYKPSNGAFSTYAAICICNEVYRESTKMHRLKRNGGVAPVSLNTTIGGTDMCDAIGDIKELIDMIESDGESTESEAIANVMLEEIRKLAPTCVEMAERCQNGGQYARAHGVSRQAINQRCATERRRINKYYGIEV